MDNSTLNLQFDRPIVFVKTHTTGIDPKRDRIIEISMIKFMTPDNKTEGVRRFNPGISITNTEFHGITDADVANEGAFADHAESIASFLSECDIAGFNVNFDLKFISNEMNRAGISFTPTDSLIVDAQNIFHKMAPRDFHTACKIYMNMDYAKGQSAPTFNNTCISLLNTMIGQYQGKKVKDGNNWLEITNKAKDIDLIFNMRSDFLDITGKIVKNAQGKAAFAFGKMKGRLVEEVINEQPDYIDWMINSDLPSDTKAVVSNIRTKIQATATAG